MDINEKKYATITSADDVTDEVMDMVREIEAGWFTDKRIDWEDVWYRMEKSTLADGREIDMGPEMDSPAMRKIKKIINKERREG